MRLSIRSYLVEEAIGRKKGSEWVSGLQQFRQIKSQSVTFLIFFIRHWNRNIKKNRNIYHPKYRIPSKSRTTCTIQMLDFKLKSRPCNTAPIDSSKNATFLAINHKTISFEADTYKGNKKVPHRFTIIRPLQAGWAGAPYKKNQKGVPVKRLSEMLTTDHAGPAIKLYSFEKGGTTMEKGPRRDDVSFDIQSGAVLNFWLDEQRLAQMKKDQPTLPESIPMFTVCEIQVAPRNADAATKSSACKISDVRPKSFTLHSCMEVSIRTLRSQLAQYATNARSTRRRTSSACHHPSRRRARCFSSTSRHRQTSPTT
jgi:hypothetical protein